MQAEAPSSDDRLARLRALRDLHGMLLARGVPVRGSEQLAQSMALLFRDCLTNRNDKRRVPRAAELAHRLYDQAEQHAPPGAPLACKAGCDYCCHAFVSLLAPEAFLLAEKVSQRDGEGADAMVETFKRRAQALRGLDQAARLARDGLPCPLLEEHLCTVHPSRPLSCRKHASFSVEPCMAAFGGEDALIPANTEYLTLGTTCSVTLRAALASVAYSTALYELSEAVSTILDTENALQRWTEGEDVLAHVQTDTTTPARFAPVITALVSAIA